MKNLLPRGSERWKEKKALPNELLRLYRNRSGLTQSQLGRLLEFSGDRMIRKWESGYNLPEPKRLQKLIELYLEKQVFINGQEISEANDLWNSVKNMAEAQSKSPVIYPIFDGDWFKALWEQKAALTVTPMEIPTGPTPAMHNLPVAVTSFVGRQKELSEIKQLLQTTHLLTLTGAGGIGKTRLALETASQVLGDFVDGIWMVELAALTGPYQVPQAVATVLGVKEIAREPLSLTLLNYLKPKKLLLILDNCEHLLHPAAKLAGEFIQNCPELKILATSRERLGLSGETSWRVPVLSLPSTQAVAFDVADPRLDITQFEAVQLLVDRARAVQPDFRLDDLNRLPVARLCQQLDGIPLAIELAAARVRVLTIEQINRRLNERFRLLTGGSQQALPRQQNLQALIEWSYDLLTTQEQKLLRRLTVFAEGWSLEAAESVCAGEGLQPGEILELMAELVNKSLVAAEPQGRNMRYHLLESIRRFGLEKLREQKVETRWQAAHLDYFLKFAAEIEPELVSQAQKEGFELLEQEHGNLRTALEWAIQNQAAASALQLCVKLGYFWETRCYYTEAKDFLTRSLALAAPTEMIERAGALRDLARLAFLQSEYELGIRYAQESLALGQQIDNKIEISASLYSLGTLVAQQGHYGAGRDYLNQALAIQKAINYEKGLASTLSVLGLVALNQNDYATSRVCYSEALVITRRTGNKFATVKNLNNLGIIAMDQGDYAAAGEAFQEGVKVAKELANKDLRANALTNLGIVAFHKGDYPAALAYYQESLALHKELGNRQHVANVLNNMGEIERIKGNYRAAYNYYQEALVLREKISDKWGAALELNNLGNVATNQGDYTTAEKCCRESLSIRQEMGNKLGVASCYNNLGHLAQLQKQPEIAREFHEQSLALRREAGDKSGTASSLANLGLLAFCEGAAQTANELIRESLNLVRGLDNKLLAAEVLAVLLIGWSGQPAKTAQTGQLWKSIEAILTQTGAAFEMVYRQPYQAALNRWQSRAGSGSFGAGPTLEILPALDFALSHLPD